ncbi:MAG: hypothetical protein HC927_13535, partial [Deltaproteobacteria bacterium]|nr:hypothetical protein [Deltaproteobacteria bacterium]
AGDDVGESESEEGESTGETGSEGESDTQDDEGEPLRPNWHEDIAPLVHGSCVGCHFEGGIAPFSLTTYSEAAAWSSFMSEVVSADQMPPWGALETEDCQPDHTWRNDVRLSPEQKQLFADWVAVGAPEGDPANAQPLPEPPSLELKEPTAVLQNPAPYTVGGTKDSFVCVAIDPQVDQDVWITGVQMVPDNVQVVHHVLMYVDTLASSDNMVDENGTFPCEGGFITFEGSMQIGTWVPGAVPTEMPPDVGLPMPAGSRLVLAYHYHPTGAGDEIDQSSIALRWTEEAPEVNAFMGLFGNGMGLEPGPNDPNGIPVFEIPPNVADHTERMKITLPDFLPPVELFTLGTHMHYVGVDMRVWIERDGEELCMLHTPRWDFNWQRNYDIDAPLGELPTVKGGDVLRLECKYDNTLNNPFLVEALAEQGLSEPIKVSLGEGSLDEMCLMLFGVATDLPLDQFF